MSREAHLVELVDTAGHPTGESTVDDAHRTPGRLHRAFSVLLLDPDGRVLLQRRSAEKTRFPLRWANACCGHPTPGTPVAAAAARRLVEELAVSGVALDELGVYSYAADDPGTDPDPAEVDELRWVAPAELAREIAAEPDRFAPWLVGVLALLPEGAGDR